MAIYVSIVEELLKHCKQYRIKELSIDHFKASLLNYSVLISSIEDDWLRDFLENQESKLDLIQFTTIDSKIFERTLPILDEIEECLSLVYKRPGVILIVNRE